jgi:hypothetical protein
MSKLVARLDKKQVTKKQVTDKKTGDRQDDYFHIHSS